MTTSFRCTAASCDRSFSTKYNLVRHVLVTHLNVRKYDCNYCGAKFGSKQNLEEHINIHEDRRPFKCTVCGKKFRWTSQLSVHKKTHKKKSFRGNVDYALKLTDILTPQALEVLSKNQHVKMEKSSDEIVLPSINYSMEKEKPPSLSKFYVP